MLNIKPGWKTSEHWHAVISQGLALLVAMGIITQADSMTLEGAIASGITALFVVIANSGIVKSYIQSRLALKENAAEPALTEEPNEPTTPTMPDGVP